MIQRLSAQLPVWARLENPILRYGLGKPRERGKRAVYFRAFLTILLIAAFLGGGYLVATNLLRNAPGQHLTESLLAILFWPVLIIQVLTRLGVIAMTVNIVHEEKRRQTWDNLRVTERGAELALRARWASVFYRLRSVIGIMLLVRLVLIAGILFDLTAFRGGYLDRLINGIIPEVPLFLSVILLAFLMTASILLPLTGIGLDAAIGLFVSVTVHQRVYTAIIQILWIILRVAIVAGSLYAMTQFMNGTLAADELGAWLLAGAFAAMGDWALSLLHLFYYGELWATIPYGIFLGFGLLLFALVQALITDGILALAVRQAERNG